VRRVYATVIVDFLGDPSPTDCAEVIENAIKGHKGGKAKIKDAVAPVVIFAGSKFDPAMPDNLAGMVEPKEGKQ
jgi:hypothetical protein